MQLQELLKQVRQRREADRLEKEHIAEQRRAIEAEKVQNLLYTFESAVQKYFGDVLDALSADQTFQYLNRDLECSFAIKHVIVSIGMLDRDIQSHNKNIPQVGISAHTAEGYFSRLDDLQPSRTTAWLIPEKARDYLLDLIFDICEEYDRLLPEFELARKLTECRQAIEEAFDRSSQEITVLNTVLKQWQWPEGRKLELFRITWCTAAVWQPVQKEYAFDYEFGYSLSEFPDDRDFYRLLPRSGVHFGRHIKPGNRLTIERLVVTEDTIPEELLEKPTQQLKFVKVYDCIWEQSSRVLPQFLPDLPPEIADNFVIEPSIETFELNIPRIPCFEIRQAL